MISSKKLLGSLALVVASPLIPFSLAYANSDPRDSCYWANGNVGPMPHPINVGTHYVPRDVPRSTPIGPVDKRYGPVGGGGLAVLCHNSGTVRLELNVPNHEPIVPGVFDPINGEDITGKVIRTNIDGIGVRFKLGTTYQHWLPVGTSVAVPYEAYFDRYTPVIAAHSVLMPLVTLVKTGDIAPGIHSLNVSNLLGGYFTGVGNGFNVSLTGTVIQAECTVSANPVSADPVDLGAWDLSEFTKVGHTTTPQAFNITLNSCMTDDRLPPETITYAHIRLDPTAGSMIHDATLGQFTLGTGSTAEGVVIQILHEDETPVGLASEVRLKPITPGNTTLNFKARFYQTQTSDRVAAGSAKGSLSFTITYL